MAPERRYLRALLSGVQDDVKLGKSMQDAIAHVAEAERPQWLLYRTPTYPSAQRRTACISSWNGSEYTVRRRGFLRRGVLAAAGVHGGRGPGGHRRAAGAPKVLIVGGGFAGSACALHLRQLVDPAIEVSLIDPVERYATCPMSNEVIAGLRSLSSITLSRSGLRRAGVQVIGAQVIGVDAQRRELRLRDGTTLAFDRLIVAPGIRFLWDRIEGYDDHAAQRMPHAWKAGAQTLLLAAQLQRMSDGGVVAISVPSGLLRCPPGPYERASLIAHYLRQHKPRSKVLILDANNSFPKQAQFTDAWNSLYPGMIEWVPVIEDGAVVRVDAAAMTLYTAAHTHRVDVANVIPPQAPERAGTGRRVGFGPRLVSRQPGKFRVDAGCRRACDRRCLHRRCHAEVRIGSREPGAAVRHCRGRDPDRPRPFVTGVRQHLLQHALTRAGDRFPGAFSRD